MKNFLILIFSLLISATGFSQEDSKSFSLKEAINYALEHNRTAKNAVRDIEAEMNGKGRVILRPSGTEPLIRVTLEGADSSQVERLANQLADMVREELLG